MIDRRILLAIGGAVVGIVGGTAAALNGAPIAGLAAGIGALAAAAGVLMSAADPRDGDGPALVQVSRPTAASPTLSAVGEPNVAPTPLTVVAPTSPGEATPPPAPVADLFAQTPPNGKVPLLTDPSTGLFSEDYFNIAIEARLAAARRHLRPVGVVLLEVVEGLRVDRVHAADPRRVADAVRETLREADTACRREDGRFALLLEDTPENGAIWTVERIRRRLVDTDASLTVWAGVACYPAHAFDKESILRAADLALVAAREWRQDRIEVAAGD